MEKFWNNNKNSGYHKSGDKPRVMETWNKFIPQSELIEKVTDITVDFAKEFGIYLGKKDNALSSSQLRKFFGEVKRIQLKGYDETSFLMLKPKLAYAVGRAKKEKPYQHLKIEDFYTVMADAIDMVSKCPKEKRRQAFENFIQIFEAIIAYHKAAENNVHLENTVK